jgi:hypothetical protein
MKRIKYAFLLAVLLLGACSESPTLDFFQDLQSAGDTIVIGGGDNSGGFNIGLANFSSQKIFVCIYPNKTNAGLADVIEIAPGKYQFIKLKGRGHLLGVVAENGALYSKDAYFNSFAPLGKCLEGIYKEDKSQIIHAVINGEERYLEESFYFFLPEYVSDFEAIAFYDNQVVTNTLDTDIEIAKQIIMLVLIIALGVIGFFMFVIIPLS